MSTSVHRPRWSTWLTSNRNSYHNELRSNVDFGSGVDIGVALVIDEDVLDCLLDPQPDVPPWVYCLDQSFDPSQVEGKLANDEYPGFVRIAIDLLVPDMWPMLVGANMSLRDVWLACEMNDPHPMWVDAFENGIVREL